jgi:hypothetical protein
MLGSNRCSVPRAPIVILQYCRVSARKETTTKNDGIIKALENAIVFFETFCLMDDFEAHVMDDETNIPSTTAKPEITVTTMPFPANKDIEYPSHEMAMKDTMVHIEYPDRTKFVSSMN